jgi:hypothetical protein
VSAGEQDAATPADPKAIATARARLALVPTGGFELEQLADGSFLVHRWNWSQTCRNLDEVEAFLRRLEAMR